MSEATVSTPDGNVSDRTGAGEQTLYIWGNHGSELACRLLFDPTNPFSEEGLRRIRHYCDARAHAMPDALAAHAAGIVLSNPPEGEDWPGQHALEWLIAEADKVDLAFVHTQLGILSGENVGAALKHDWKNAVESGDLADAIKNGEWDKAWGILRGKFKGSADAAGVVIPETPPWVHDAPPARQQAAPGAKHVSPGALRNLPHAPPATPVYLVAQAYARGAWSVLIQEWTAHAEAARAKMHALDHRMHSTPLVFWTCTESSPWVRSTNYGE